MSDEVHCGYGCCSVVAEHATDDKCHRRGWREGRMIAPRNGGIRAGSVKRADGVLSGGVLRCPTECRDRDVTDVTEVRTGDGGPNDRSRIELGHTPNLRI